MTKAQIISSVNPELASNSLEVAKKRYLKINPKGEVIETPQEMFYRTAEFMARPDKKWDKDADISATVNEFYQMLANLEFVPGGRILFEAGNNYTGQMSSCFVIPIEDSLDGIFQSLKDAAITQQNNGGTGFNFSKIRAKGDSVRGIPGVAAGPVHYLRTFDTALSKILQGSKRHGGNMGILNVDHPDVEEFINLKDNGSDIKNFNISVGVTRDFMEKIRNDQEYELINPHTKKPVKKLRAREIFNKITQRAWQCADPGMIFLDAVQEANVNDHLGVMDATNPCGEQPLLPYESCNLGSVVLHQHAEGGQINWSKLKKTVYRAVHFLDNLIEANKYPLAIIDEKVKLTRKIGIGVMGFAHLLYKMGIAYNSQEAVEMIEKIMKFVHQTAVEASKELAVTRGVYPAWEGSKWEKKGIKIRNSHLTSIAPTGTISMLANTSSGVEPVFSLVTIRRAFFEDNGNKTGGQLMKVVDPIFEEIAKEYSFYSDQLIEKIANGLAMNEIKEIPQDWKKVFVTTHDVSFDWHVKIQAVAQKWTDAAVSKTINMAHEATVDQVRQAYIMAYELGCKGITIYRDGSKEAQVLNVAGHSSQIDQKNKLDESPVERKVISPFVPKNEAVGGASREKRSAGLSQNALTVLEKRAFKKDSTGQVIETPEQLFRRVARFVAGAEKKYSVPESRIKEIEEKFYGLFSNLEFISGQALRNAETDLTLSACLVLPIEDSIESIMQAITENVMAHKATCGTGFNYSRLRPKGALVGNIGGIAAGPVTFMRALAFAQKTVQTKGGRGQGSMGILNVDHSDVEEFIKAKDKEGELTNMNISVGVTDRFMQALASDDEYEMINPHNNQVVRKVKAKYVFDQIVEHAWLTGDPGVIFVDRLERDNPTPTMGKLDATNPCGEQPLLPYETCNLGSIVLSKMMKMVGQGWEIDWDKLSETIYYSVRFLDNTIDVNKFPLEKVRQMSQNTRRIGLGVMGFADMLVRLRVPYNSDEAVVVAEKVMKFINEQAHQASEEIAKEKGSFPVFDISVWPQRGVKFQRNSAVTTIAPTGYISIVAECSSGIEPLFALAFRRQASMGGVDQVEVNQEFEKLAKEEGFYSDELMAKVAEKGSIQDLKEVPEHVRKIFVTAYDITPQWHVRIQAAFQKYTDNAVSKTINFPSNATTEDAATVYKLAYDLGCKGVTIYRDGSKQEQALRTGLTDNEKKEQAQEEKKTVVVNSAIIPKERPEVISGNTYRVKTGYGNLFVTINNDSEGKPFEVFATIGKTGGFFSAKSEAICRLISIALRAGISVQEVIDQLKGIRGPMPTWANGTLILSIPDAIAHVLIEHVKKPQAKLDLKFANEVKAVSTKPSVDNKLKSSAVEIISSPESLAMGAVSSTSNIISSATQSSVQTKVNLISTSIADFGLAPQCPDCGANLELGEGCLLCRGCGYSKCG